MKFVLVGLEQLKVRLLAGGVWRKFALASLVLAVGALVWLVIGQQEAASCGDTGRLVRAYVPAADLVFRDEGGESETIFSRQKPGAEYVEISICETRSSHATFRGEGDLPRRLAELNRWSAVAFRVISLIIKKSVSPINVIVGGDDTSGVGAMGGLLRISREDFLSPGIVERWLTRIWLGLDLHTRSLAQMITQELLIYSVLRAWDKASANSAFGLMQPHDEKRVFSLVEYNAMDNCARLWLPIERRAWCRGVKYKQMPNREVRLYEELSLNGDYSLQAYWDPLAMMLPLLEGLDKGIGSLSLRARENLIGHLWRRRNQIVQDLQRNIEGELQMVDQGIGIFAERELDKRTWRVVKTFQCTWFGSCASSQVDRSDMPPVLVWVDAKLGLSLAQRERIFEQCGDGCSVRMFTDKLQLLASRSGAISNIAAADGAGYDTSSVDEVTNEARAKNSVAVWFVRGDLPIKQIHLLCKVCTRSLVVRLGAADSRAVPSLSAYLQGGVTRFARRHPKVAFAEVNLKWLRYAVARWPEQVLHKSGLEMLYSTHQARQSGVSLRERLGWQSPEWDGDLGAFRVRAAVPILNWFRP